MDKGSDAILFHLKMHGTASAEALASRLGISAQAARQSLERLLRDGLVAFADTPAGRGRPRRAWSLTAATQARFPDTHAELTAELIGLIRDEFGEAGLDAVVARRAGHVRAYYRSRCGIRPSIEGRLAALAEARSAEGYMAAWTREPDGSFLLVENHCPICAAAMVCQGFCASELDLFREVVGRDWRVERLDHIVAGARRCAYRISAATQAQPAAS